jgi:uncharacterized protein with HEPN domain
MRDLGTQDAVIRNFEVIGEAAKKVPAEYRAAHPSIPRQLMAGFRDVLIHGYDGVDMRRVWATATQALPEVRKSIAALLPPLEAVEREPAGDPETDCPWRLALPACVVAEIGNSFGAAYLAASVNPRTRGEISSNRPRAHNRRGITALKRGGYFSHPDCIWKRLPSLLYLVFPGLIVTTSADARNGAALEITRVTTENAAVFTARPRAVSAEMCAGRSRRQANAASTVAKPQRPEWAARARRPPAGTDSPCTPWATDAVRDHVSCVVSPDLERSS